MSGDLDDLIDAAKLLGATLLELSLDPEASAAWDNGGEDAVQYRELRGYLSDHLEAAQAGAQQSAGMIRDWQATLHDVGDRRQVICSNIMSYQEHLAREEAKQLADEARDLRGEMAALRDVQKAVDDADFVSSMTSTLLEMKGYAEAIESGDVWDLVEIPGMPSEDDVIESGIAMLGRYAVALELASHGYSSIEEIQGAIRGTLQRIEAGRDRIAWAKHRYQTAHYQYAFDSMGGG